MLEEIEYAEDAFEGEDAIEEEKGKGKGKGKGKEKGKGKGGKGKGEKEEEWLNSPRGAPLIEVPEQEDESPEQQKKVFALTNDDTPERLDVFIASRLPDYSRAYLQRLIETGYVTFEPPAYKEPKPSLKIRAGQSVRVVIPPPLKVRLRPEAISLEILYEDEALAVVNKPAGLSVHPAPDQLGSTLVNALLYWIRDLSGIAGVERPGIVHRLDKETSGVLVVAKNDRAHHGLAAQFKERTIHKRYQTIVRGEPQQWEGRIDASLGRSPTHSKKMVVRPPGRGRSAITDYRVLEIFKGYALLECYPVTGRTHQIRVHLASIRLPVAADKLYGRERRILLSDLCPKRRKPDQKLIIERHALHAAGVTFRHPITQEEMTFTAPLEDDMLNLLRTLQTHRSRR